MTQGSMRHAIKALPFGSPEEIDTRIARQREQRSRLRADCADTKGFCAFELGHWADLAVKAGVPMIPATAVAVGPTDAWNDWEEGHPFLNSMISRSHAAVASSAGHQMLRWSWASHGIVKSLVNGGERRWRPDLAELYVEDERSYELQLDFPLPTFAIWMRPWVELKTVKAPLPMADPAMAAEERSAWNEVRNGNGQAPIEGRLPTYDEFALEVRVFVREGRIAGVSAYYPQCPLDARDPAVGRLFSTARDFAERLIAAQNRPLILPQCPDLHGRVVNAWSADFVMTETERVLLLEGGPPHTPAFGAHPCCFLGREIVGDAFACSPMT